MKRMNPFQQRAVFALLGMILTSPAFAQDFIVERNVMIPMRDGILLSADIYRPARDGVAVEERLPVLLTRTPYGKDRERTAETAAHFARHGYVSVVQDMRGRYDSQGEFTKYAAVEAPDGYDTVEWLAKLPYADGRVGMWGTSYGAHTQADAAKMNPPSLKAIHLNQGGMANAWDHAVRHGGAFELGRELTWAFRYVQAETDDPVVRAHFDEEKIADWYNALPFRRGLNPLSIAPEYEEYILSEYTNSDYTDFWRRITLNWSEYYDQTADVAMHHVGGWYDIFLRGTIMNYVALSERSESPVEMTIGPWVHSGNARTYAGDVDFGPDAAIPDFFNDFKRRWFDRHLKDAPTNRKPVRLFVMGTGDGRKDEAARLVHGGYWTEADDWPIPGAQSVAWYFNGDGSLTTDAPTAGDSATTYTFDPEHPVPTLGGNVSGRVNDGAYNQRERADFPASRPPYLPLRSRDDVVVFQTPPLEEDVTVVGPIEVVLYASSTALDTDFTAKLVDVYPPSEHFPAGFDMNISDALIRASYRDGRHERDLIEPGEVYKLVIRPFATANVFKKRHRIRVDISSSNFPRFDVNPNTGEPLGQNRRSITADNTVYHSEEYPSHVVLPVMTVRPPALSAME